MSVLFFILNLNFSKFYYYLIFYAVEDFSSTLIPFTIRANSTQPENRVVVIINNDDQLEPVSEGFRLILSVNLDLTPLTYVSSEIGRQIALFRIDDLTDGG